jgi:hypothetical protein
VRNEFMVDHPFSQFIPLVDVPVGQLDLPAKRRIELTCRRSIIAIQIADTCSAPDR